MLQLLFISISAAISILFLQMSHPLAMGLTLLVQTLFICLISGQMYYSFWFSYILFLIFLGGMLVLFIYVTSLASNEMFSFSSSTISLFFAFTGLSMISLIILMQFYQPAEFISDMISNSNSMMFSSAMMNMMKLYNFPSMSITILLVLYLLITLIACVKITNLFYGPLRKMM